MAALISVPACAFLEALFSGRSVSDGRLSEASGSPPSAVLSTACMRSEAEGRALLRAYPSTTIANDASRQASQSRPIRAKERSQKPRISTRPVLRLSEDVHSPRLLLPLLSLSTLLLEQQKLLRLAVRLKYNG